MRGIVNSVTRGGSGGGGGGSPVRDVLISGPRFLIKKAN